MSQPDLFAQAPPEPRCVACESPLVLAHRQEHIQPIYVCCTPQCSAYGKCLTCAMLAEWFHSVDIPAEED